MSLKLLSDNPTVLVVMWQGVQLLVKSGWMSALKLTDAPGGLAADPSAADGLAVAPMVGAAVGAAVASIAVGLVATATVGVAGALVELTAADAVGALAGAAVLVAATVGSGVTDAMLAPFDVVDEAGDEVEADEVTAVAPPQPLSTTSSRHGVAQRIKPITQRNNIRASSPDDTTRTV